MTIPLVILAMLSVAAGWGTQGYFESPTPGEAHGHATLPVILAIAAFAAGTALAFVLYSGKKREPVTLPLFRNRFYLDEIYGAIVAGTQDILAFIANALDALLSGLARAAGMAAWGIGFMLRLFQFGNVQGYSFVFGLGVVALIWFLVFR